MDFGVLYIDLLEEVQVEVICGLFGIGGTGEAETSRLEIKLQRFGRHVGDRDCQVDVVLFGIAG